MPEPDRVEIRNGIMRLIYDDGSVRFARQLPGQSWRVQSESGDIPVDPEPGNGQFRWPFNPVPQELGGDCSDEYKIRSASWFHEGMDFASPGAYGGAPVPVAHGGEVIEAGTNSGWGLKVVVAHGTFGEFNYVHTTYNHLSRIDVSVGQRLAKSAIVGLVGNTGGDYPMHLHWELHSSSGKGILRFDGSNGSFNSNRTAINPRDFMAVYGG